jgi:hypothetical protein
MYERRREEDEWQSAFPQDQLRSNTASSYSGSVCARFQVNSLASSNPSSTCDQANDGAAWLPAAEGYASLNIMSPTFKESGPRGGSL